MVIAVFFHQQLWIETMHAPVFTFLAVLSEFCLHRYVYEEWISHDIEVDRLAAKWFASRSYSTHTDSWVGITEWLGFHM